MPMKKLKWKGISLNLEVATPEDMEEETDAGNDSFMFMASYKDESNVINDIDIRIKRRINNNSSTAPEEVKKNFKNILSPEDVKAEAFEEEEEAENFEEEEEASTALLDKKAATGSVLHQHDRDAAAMRRKEEAMAARWSRGSRRGCLRTRTSSSPPAEW